MHVSGADYVAGAVQPAGRGIADDGLIISPHGTVTHIDALCHFWAGEQLYNGHPQSTVRGYGARRCGVEKLGPVVGRGILLDVPRCTGRGRLEPDERIGVADLQRCMREQDLEVEAGDIVLVRTGWATVYEDDPGLYAQAQPGLSPEAADWLADRDAALVGADNAAVGPLAGGTGLHVPLEEDIHLLFLWRRGVPLLEMLQLEELSRCRPGPFLFVTVPLPIRGGTGSPVNPVAIL
jgi:kynurenine formamidase